MATAKRRKEKETRRPVTRADFVGAKMANFLFAMAHNATLDEHTRKEARLLCEQWDNICVFRINNPIIKIELEKALQAGELK
jgi:hypothetical protein